MIQILHYTKTVVSTHRSNDDKIFAGIGRKLRIDVGGKVVEVKMGRLVERVCVDVVGWVFELTRACDDSVPEAFKLSVEPIVEA